MKHFLPTTILFTSTFLITSCEPSRDEASNQRIHQLEVSSQELQQHKNALARELADQKLAMEWDAIERERKQIEADQATMAHAQAQAQALKAIKLREEELAKKQAEAEALQDKLALERMEIEDNQLALSESQLALAGREPGEIHEADSPDPEVVDLEFFQTSLEPYGSWFETEEYGAVWRPAACREPGWRPYTRGQWICTDRGWTWVSAEPFGWATYHYGRWAQLDGHGWIWVPGCIWAPNWCAWQSSNNHIGWAPLPPGTLNHSWNSIPVSSFNLSPSCYNFVRTQHFDHSIARYCLPVAQNHLYLGSTRNITHIKVVGQQIFCGGPAYLELSKLLNRPLPFCHIERDKTFHTRPGIDQLRSRIKGKRLIVAAPAIKQTRPIQPGIRLNHPTKVTKNQPTRPHLANHLRPTPSPAIRPTPNANPTPAAPLARPSLKPSKRPLPMTPTSPPMDKQVRSNPAAAPRPNPTPNIDRERARRIAELQTKATREAEARIQREAILRQEETTRRDRETREAAQKAEQQKRLAQMKEQEKIQRQHREAAERQRNEIKRRQQADKERKERDDQQRRMVEEARKQREETQRRQREEAEQKERAGQQRQRAEEARRQQEESSRRQREEMQQRQQREDARRQQEEQQRKQQREQQRPRRSR